MARALEGRVANRPKIDEASDVKAALTLADSAAQEAILVTLAERFPDVALRAEEDTPGVAQFPTHGDRLVVIDPIDGTLHGYLEGKGPYAVMAGLAERRRFEASIVALPREGLVFFARSGGRAFLRRALSPPRPVERLGSGRRVLVSQHAPASVDRALRGAGYAPIYGCGGAIAVAPLIPGVCGGVRISPGPEGVSVRGRIGLLVARAAGASVESLEGSFPGDLDTPASTLVTAASPDVCADLRSILRGA